MKRILNQSIIAIAAFVSVGITGCDKIKDFGNTNVNPNETPIPVTGALFTRAIAELGGRENGLAISAYTRPGYPESLYFLDNYRPLG